MTDPKLEEMARELGATQLQELDEWGVKRLGYFTCHYCDLLPLLKQVDEQARREGAASRDAEVERLTDAERKVSALCEEMIDKRQAAEAALAEAQRVALGGKLCISEQHKALEAREAKLRGALGAAARDMLVIEGLIRVGNPSEAAAIAKRCSGLARAALSGEVKP